MDRLPLLPYAVRCGALLLALAFVLNAAAFAAQSTDGGVKRVLVISTGSRLAPGFVMVDQHLLQVLGQIQSPQIDVYAENLDIIRFPADRARAIFADYLTVKYATHPPDLVILIFVGNLGITAKVLGDLFPGTPIIVAGYSEEDFSQQQLGDRVSGFAQRIDAAATLKLISRIHPDLKRLVVIGGTADVDRQILDRARTAAQAYAGRFDIEVWNDMPMAALRKAVTSLPPKTAVLYTRLFRDAAGQAFISSEVSRWIGAHSNAPVYVLSDTGFGTGAVGGVVASVEDFGKRAGELARRELTGTAAASFPFEVRTAAVPLFDWRALQRWGIDERVLPADSVIRFRQVSIWQQYGWYIVGALIVIVLQALMIALLFVQRRDLRRIQASLREQQQLVELATEAGELGLWSRDIKSGELWANAALRSILRLDPQSSLRFDDVLSSVHPGDRDRVFAELNRAAAAGLPSQIEYRVQFPDGTQRWVLARGRSMVDLRVKDSSRMGVVLDITERKRAEESLRGQQAFLRQVIDTAPNFIFAKDREGRFTLANQAVAEAYGAASADELIGKTDADFNRDPAEVEFFRRIDAEVMDTRREHFIPEERLTDAYGRVRWLQTVKRPIVEADGAVRQVLGASTDITQRKRTELELQEQRSELAHVGRISMMGELAASLVHELNQPLTAILSNASAGLRFMAREPVDLQELHDVLEDIVAANNRAADIIHSMRALIKKDEKPEFAALDVAILIADVARLAHGDALQKDVRILLQLDADLPTVRGDRVQLQQVLLNILLNAFDAMRACDANEREVTVRAQSRKDGFVLIAVRDTGPGLDESAIERIFQPFYTTKHDGLGMGLSICRSIINAHGGVLWAENNPERGATFYFTVPVAHTEWAPR